MHNGACANQPENLCGGNPWIWNSSRNGACANGIHPYSYFNYSIGKNVYVDGYDTNGGGFSYRCSNDQDCNGQCPEGQTWDYNEQECKGNQPEPDYNYTWMCLGECNQNDSISADKFCSQFTEKNSCQNHNCKWDRWLKCIADSESSDLNYNCEEINTQSSCNKITGCFWNANSEATCVKDTNECKQTGGGALSDECIDANRCSDPKPVCDSGGPVIHDPEYCTIRFDANGGSSAPQTQNLECGDTGSEPADDPSKKCYKFTGWYKDSQVRDWTKSVTEDITLIANYTPITYKIRYNCNGGTQLTATNIQNVEYGSIGMLNSGNVCTRTGYNFLGWSTGQNATFATWAGGAEMSGVLTEKCENQTLHAVWQEQNKCSVTFYPNGGTPQPPVQSGYCGKFNSYKPSDPSKTGQCEDYKFVKWNDDGGNRYNFGNVVNASINLYAEYTSTPKTFTVTYDGNGGTLANSTTAEVIHGNSVDLNKTATRDGYTFVGWSTGENSTTALNNYNMPCNDVRLYAIWKENIVIPQKTFTATFKANGNTIGDGTWTSNDITKSCTTTGESCNITSPSIKAPENTPNVIGYSSSSDDHTNQWSGGSQKLISGNVTYYAQTSGHKKITVTYNKDDDSVKGIGSLSAQYETTIYNGVSRNIDFKIPTCTPKDCYGDCKFYDVSGKSYVPGNSYWFSEDITLTAKADKIEGCSIPQCGEDRGLCAEGTPSNPNPDINFLPPKHEQNNNGWTHRSQWICEGSSEVTNSEVTCTQYYSNVVVGCPIAFERDGEKCVPKAKYCARKKNSSNNYKEGNGICFGEEYMDGITHKLTIGQSFANRYTEMNQNDGSFGSNPKVRMQSYEPRGTAAVLPCDSTQESSRASEVMMSPEAFENNGCILNSFKPGGNDDGYYLTCKKITDPTDRCQMLGRSSKVIQNP